MTTKQPIIYSAAARTGSFYKDVRFSCGPILDDASYSCRATVTRKDKKRFGSEVTLRITDPPDHEKRVVFWMNPLLSNYDFFRKSCRGVDYSTRTSPPFFETEADAILWLIEGEYE